eukprot:5647158-Amphidinium_carterae.1
MKILGKAQQLPASMKYHLQRAPHNGKLKPAHVRLNESCLGQERTCCEPSLRWSDDDSCLSSWSIVPARR